MKKAILVLVFCLSLFFSNTACVPMTAKFGGKLDETKVVTNAKFIENVFADINIPDGVFTNKDIVVLASLENLDRNFPVNFQVEDILINKLVNKSVRVLERDQEVVMQLLFENKTSLLNEYTYSVAFDNSKIINTELLAKDILPGANRVLGYRVQYMGVQYSQAETKTDGGDGFSSTNIKYYRTGRVELLIRIIDVPSGQIVWASTLNASKKEEINPELINLYERDSDLMFYKGLPNVKKTEESAASQNSLETVLPQPPR